MRRAFLLLIGSLLLSAGTGCGICDQMFAFHKPYGGGDCGCNSCGCGAGGCPTCGDGAGDPGDGGGYAGGGHHGYPNGGYPPHDMLPRGAGGEYLGQGGPPTGGVAYPYYTTRGPRDFLVNNPPSIGP
jgi:hypothetical protein